MHQYLGAVLLTSYTNVLVLQTLKKFAKSNCCCCMLPFLRQLLQLARLHKYISSANIPVIPVVLVFPAFMVVPTSRSLQLPGHSGFPVGSRPCHIGFSVVPIVPVIPGQSRKSINIIGSALSLGHRLLIMLYYGK
jgi:hypothetical protein